MFLPLMAATVIIGKVIILHVNLNISCIMESISNISVIQSKSSPNEKYFPLEVRIKQEIFSLLNKDRDGEKRKEKEISMSGTNCLHLLIWQYSVIINKGIQY